MGASSTGGETTRGRGGSDMAAWTGLSLGILRQVDGDEDLAPRVLAWLSQGRWPEVRAAWLRQKVALVWLFFGTYLKFK